MTALTLSRVGVHVTLLERSGPDRSRGGGIFVSDGLVERVTGWGLAPGTPPVPTTLSGGMHSWHTIFTALYAAAHQDPGITVVHHARAITADQDDAAAWVVADSGAVHRADIVIGADGHRSVVRAAVAPQHRHAAFAGYLVWIATIEERDLPERLRGHRTFDRNAFLGDDTAMLLGGSFPGEDGDSRRRHRTVGWAVYDNTHNDLLTRGGHVRDGVVHHSVAASEVPADLGQSLARLGRGRWSSTWTDLIQVSLDAGRVIGTPISEYVPEVLADGRLAIVGDAAHVATPMTGSGFTEALHDAETLAAAIVAHPTVTDGWLDAPRALESYAQRRLMAARNTVLSGQHFSHRFRAAA